MVNESNLRFTLDVALALNSQLGEILDAGFGPPRILGPVSNRHGV